MIKQKTTEGIGSYKQELGELESLTRKVTPSEVNSMRSQKQAKL